MGFLLRFLKSTKVSRRKKAKEQELKQQQKNNQAREELLENKAR